MHTITTREQLLAVPNGTLMVDKDGYAMTRTHEGEFALWSPDEARWKFYGIGEIDGTLLENDVSTFFPIQLPDTEPQSAETWLSQAHDRWQAANNDVTLASILLLARMARERWPEAVGIELDDSDQGNWYVIASVRDAEGNDLNEEDCDFDDNTGYASGLDDSSFGTFAPFCMSKDAHVSRRWGITNAVLDIDAILEGVKPA